MIQQMKNDSSALILAPAWIKQGCVICGLIVFSLPLMAREALQRFPYFGDLHVHTSWSLDSYVSYNRVGPRAAYRFAGGEPVVLSGGRVVRLDRPLDFAAVTDHAEYLGELPLCTDETSDRYSLELCRDIRNESGQESYMNRIFRELIIRDVVSANPQREPDLCGEDNTRCLARAKSTWRELQDIAHEFNRPGAFTTFIGYEWTGNPDGNNLHRNVIYGNDSGTGIACQLLRGEHAGKIVAAIT